MHHYPLVVCQPNTHVCVFVLHADVFEIDELGGGGVVNSTRSAGASASVATTIVSQTPFKYRQVAAAAAVQILARATTLRTSTFACATRTLSLFRDTHTRTLSKRARGRRHTQNRTGYTPREHAHTHTPASAARMLNDISSHTHTHAQFVVTRCVCVRVCSEHSECDCTGYLKITLGPRVCAQGARSRRLIHSRMCRTACARAHAAAKYVAFAGARARCYWNIRKARRRDD